MISECDFRFDSDGSLVLCGPADQKMRRPNSFEGVGLCIMRRLEEKTDKHMEKCLTQALQPLFEPDPEFSRRSTEEHGASSHANQFSDPHAMYPKKNHWMQEPCPGFSCRIFFANLHASSCIVNHCKMLSNVCDSH